MTNEPNVHEISTEQMFVGRDEELKILCDAYESVNSDNGPKIVAIHAESGFGKTRLAQEFYGWLSKHHDGVGGDGYWPDDLLQIENNLQVNPDLDGCGANYQKMPFLWWGLRISDPGARNQTADAAVSSGVSKLKPHLENYLAQTKLEKLARERKKGAFESAKSFVQEQGLEVIKSLLEDHVNSATFGLLEIGKAVVSEKARRNKIDAQIAMLNELNLQPGASARRDVDELSEKILDDLSILCKFPPKGEQPIPLVLLVDDIQWMEADPGVTSFLQLLIKRARRENWPLMVIFTCWSTEWLQSKEKVIEPAKWLSETDAEIALSKNAQLDLLIKKKFVGLSKDDIAALSSHADGNPRLLLEILSYLERNPRYFVNRNSNCALRENSIEKVLAKDFGDFIADRFDASPDHVKQALYIASVQGVIFSQELVKKVAKEMNFQDVTEGLIKSDNPHSFTILRDGGEFRIKRYRDIIYKNLENVMDEGDVLSAMRRQIEHLLQDVDNATDRELEAVFNFVTNVISADQLQPDNLCKLGAEVIRRKIRNLDMISAGRSAKLVLDALTECIEKVTFDDLRLILDAEINLYGPREAHANIVEAFILTHRNTLPENSMILPNAVGWLCDLVEALEGADAALPLAKEATQIWRVLVGENLTRGARRGLSIALGRLCDLLAALQGPATALPLAKEATAICRALDDEEPTLDTLHDLSVALDRLCDLVEALDGAKAALPLAEEVVAISRALAFDNPPFEARYGLAIALGQLSHILLKLRGADAALPCALEATEICRALVEESPTFDARRSLSHALGRLGYLMHGLDETDTALDYLEEETKICRALAIENPTLDVRRDLAVALGRLGDLLWTLKGPAAALSLAEEATQIWRALVGENPTRDARRGLSNALNNLSNVVHLLQGPNAALPLAEEVTEICRDLAVENPTFEDRRKLALASRELGDLMHWLNEPEAALIYARESMDIHRALAEESSTDGARRDLSIALGRLCGLLRVLDGPAAALPYALEATDICRGLVQEHPTHAARQDLATCLSGLGDLVKALENPSLARVLFNEASKMVSETP